MPPYVIFHDAALRDMAASAPKRSPRLANITGVGQRKLDAYGEAFLREIARN